MGLLVVIICSIVPAGMLDIFAHNQLSGVSLFEGGARYLGGRRATCGQLISFN